MSTARQSALPPDDDARARSSSAPRRRAARASSQAHPAQELAERGVHAGERGEAAAAGLKRPRLTWNVAVYHRWRGGVEPEGAAAGDTVGIA